MFQNFLNSFRNTSNKLTWSATSFLLGVVRIVFLAMTVGIAVSAMSFVTSHPVPTLLMVLGIAGLILLIDLNTRNKQITTISAIYFGLLMGFLLATLFWQALEPVVHTYVQNLVSGDAPAKPDSVATVQKIENLIRLFITLIGCYIGVSFLLQTKDDFRFIIPYVEFSKQIKGTKPLVLDTSVIIDGRIADICDTGFIDTRLIVPNFVLQELQGIADSSDRMKRNRGRRGMDILKRMQGNPKIDLQMHEANLAELREVEKVDERIVVLAKILSARVVTNDFNLNKISQLQGVEVINLNELSNALKVIALPGELLQIKIVKQGDQPGQGIGYLDDGTMVVVEQGRSHLGQDVSIAVTSALQTPSGRMIFGRIDVRAPADQRT